MSLSVRCRSEQAAIDTIFGQYEVGETFLHQRTIAIMVVLYLWKFALNLRIRQNMFDIIVACESVTQKIF